MDVQEPTDATASWLKFLNPESLKQNLIQASTYITCWEMLKESIVDNPRDFYTHEWRDGKGIPGPNYAAEVLSLDRDPFLASALWFKKEGAVSDVDIDLLRRLRNHRNEIAHELPKFIAVADKGVSLKALDEILYLTSKIDKWWIQNIEIPTNPDFDAHTLTEKDFNEVYSMRMMLMSLLVPVAQGNDSALREVFNGFKEHCDKMTAVS